MAVRIIVSLNFSQREKYFSDFLNNLGIKNPHPDLLYIDDDSKLGVDEAKLVREHLSLKPFSFDKRVVLLISAHKLTLEAQNSLLKTLEEPPVMTEIILGVEKLDNLLDTVISRCEIVYLDQGKDDNLRVKEINIKEFIDKNITDRFKQIEKIEDKQKFLEQLIEYERQELHQGQTSVQTLDELLTIQKWIKNNVNEKASLEYAALVIQHKD